MKDLLANCKSRVYALDRFDKRFSGDSVQQAKWLQRVKKKRQ